MKLGYSPYSYPNSIYPFDSIFTSAERLDYTPAKKCDAIILWGGTDINPKYYNEEPHPANGYYPDSHRDQYEWQWMSDAIAAGVPIIGVCRGAQFLCAKAGGKLIQHMSGHGMRNHRILTLKGEYTSTSDHHQALIPDAVEHKLIAWAEDGIPEIVYFPKIKGLAIQSHPEWEEMNNPIVSFELALVTQLLEGKL